jgi:hypothetical protein
VRLSLGALLSRPNRSELLNYYLLEFVQGFREGHRRLLGSLVGLKFPPPRRSDAGLEERKAHGRQTRRRKGNPHVFFARLLAWPSFCIISAYLACVSDTGFVLNGHFQSRVH